MKRTNSKRDDPFGLKQQFEELAPKKLVKDGPGEEKVKKREAKALDKKVAKAEPKEETKKVSAKKAAKEETKKSVEVMLASVYEPEKHDPTGWHMSEKLDGVRCLWDGKNLYSRNGNLFYPPQYFKDALPKDIELDGELWTKRNDF